MFFFRNMQNMFSSSCTHAAVMMLIYIFFDLRVPPPHLSPFVDNDQEGHMPDYAVTLEGYKSVGQNQVMPLPGLGDEDLGNSIVEAKSEHNEFAKKKKEVSSFPFQYTSLL